MKITFICVGGIKSAYVKDGVNEYMKRIRRYAPVDAVETRETVSSLKMPRADLLRDEGERIVKKIKACRGRGYLVALDERGASFSTSGFAEFIGRLMSGGKSGISFVVGGAYGLHEDVIGLCDTTLSLSAMTLPHELARLVLAEQVYRAFTILKGTPYSH